MRILSVQRYRPSAIVSDGVSAGNAIQLAVGLVGVELFAVRNIAVSICVQNSDYPVGAGSNFGKSVSSIDMEYVRSVESSIRKSGAFPGMRSGKCIRLG